MQWADRRLVAAALGPSGLAIGWAAGVLGQPQAVPSLAVALIMLIAGPIVEEIIFRGGLQCWLLMQGWGRRSLGTLSVANIATSIVFAAVHMVARHTPAALWVGLASLAFGWIYERDERLAPAIGLHAFYNALWLGAIVA